MGAGFRLPQKATVEFSYLLPEFPLYSLCIDVEGVGSLRDRTRRRSSLFFLQSTSQIMWKTVSRGPLDTRSRGHASDKETRLNHLGFVHPDLLQFTSTNSRLQSKHQTAALQPKNYVHQNPSYHLRPIAMKFFRPLSHLASFYLTTSTAFSILPEPQDQRHSLNIKDGLNSGQASDLVINLYELQGCPNDTYLATASNPRYGHQVSSSITFRGMKTNRALRANETIQLRKNSTIMPNYPVGVFDMAGVQCADWKAEKNPVIEGGGGCVDVLPSDIFVLS